MSIPTEKAEIFQVLVNHEEQYSLWREEWPKPLGWKETGTTGKKEECLAYVNRVWTDMRPLSLRRHMEAQAAKEQTKTNPDQEAS
jgi:MbtH protein